MDNEVVAKKKMDNEVVAKNMSLYQVSILARFFGRKLMRGESDALLGEYRKCC
jgi:hypothetical protein